MLSRDVLEDLQFTPRLRSLDIVRVSKKDLIEKIKDNRKEHRQIFEEAIDAWHKDVQAKLAELVEQAKKGPAFVNLYVGLPRPEDHTREYDRVIKMLEMSQDDELELTQQQFAQYVMDDWSWQRDFIATASNYSALARRKFGNYDDPGAQSVGTRYPGGLSSGQ